MNQEISDSSICCICDEVISEIETRTFEELVFCQKHFQVYKDNQWELYKEIISDPQKPELGVELYQEQRSLYSSGEISFIKSSYQISEDKIITILKLYRPIKS